MSDTKIESKAGRRGFVLAGAFAAAVAFAVTPQSAEANWPHGRHGPHWGHGWGYGPGVGAFALGAAVGAAANPCYGYPYPYECYYPPAPAYYYGPAY
jgi:hypothetical protein